MVNLQSAEHRIYILRRSYVGLALTSGEPVMAIMFSLAFEPLHGKSSPPPPGTTIMRDDDDAQFWMISPSSSPSPPRLLPWVVSGDQIRASFLEFVNLLSSRTR